MSAWFESEGVEKIIVRISRERFSVYLHQFKCDDRQGLEFYLINAFLSESLYTPIQGLEICLRNAINDVLTIDLGVTWYENSSLLKDAEKRSIKKAKDAIIKERRSVTPGRMVSNLSFGFWTALFEKRDYETLWRSSLRKCFVTDVSLMRKDISDDLEQIRRLRNRIAHHEPIIFRNLEFDYNRIIKIIRLICPHTAEWIDERGNFKKILNEKTSMSTL